jgi:NAD(P)-dependent dehydrogenase (short-subunit alcohol dehydrogenase family)
LENVNWFQEHCGEFDAHPILICLLYKFSSGYSVAKYNMTLYALAMAQEFRSDGIAVNTLWPKTRLYKAMLG